MELIVARAKNKVIGDSSKNDLPWPRIRQDLQFFRKNTVGKAVLMGRRTWESLPDSYRPLPDRLNIVISRNMVGWQPPENVRKVGSWDEAREIADRENLKLIVIGGGDLYSSAMSELYASIERVFLTQLQRDYSGDVFFDHLFDDWKIGREENFSETLPDSTEISGTFYTYQRA
ncbi:MAG: dihydrofolate reductase [Gammaproteobacteria bacterium AqS3]|nr:dihydrofolate reductase [Gammaproteobacteria bacterium AqS3]